MHILYFHSHLSTDRELADNFVKDLVKIRQIVIKAKVNNVNQTDPLLRVSFPKIIPKLVNSVEHV